MNKNRFIWRWVPVILIVAAVLCYAASLFSGAGVSSLDDAASDLGRKVEKRIGLLDNYIDKALVADEWMELDHLPADMVVYRYVEDTLQSWAHQFPIRNDDIRPLTLVQRLGDSRSQLVSPLADVSSELTYVNHGPKWYLEKAVEGEGCRIIAGLEMVNELQAGSLSGINRNFRVEESYRLRPLSNGSGVAVQVNGVPLFKLTAETLTETSQRHSSLLWLAVALLLAGTLMLLTAHPRLEWLAGVGVVQAALLVWMYLNGRSLGQVSQIFSPLLYADGPFLYSLGAVIIVNLGINLALLDVYLVRWTLLKATRRRNNPFIQGLLASLAILLAVAVVVYMHLTFKSIMVNSNITMELYKISLLTPYSGIVYLSFLALTLALPLLLQLASPLVRSLTGIRYDMFARPGRLFYAAAVGIYFVVTSSTLGFAKEQRRVDVWANRLAMNRDIGLEIQLRGAEGAIAADPMIGMLSVLDGGADIIRSRISSNYMGRIAQNYDIGVVPYGAPEFGVVLDRLRTGVRLGDNSHFFYNTIGSSRTAYTGLFTYYVSGRGSSSVLVTVESKHNREDRGYLSLLGIADPGRVTIPPVFSWAKYTENRLVQYKGSYPYPTVFSGRLKDHINGHTDIDGYCHFVDWVSEDEVIVISRKATEKLYYVVEGFLFAIIAFGSITLLTRRGRRSGGRRYYQNRINLIMSVSLAFTLVAMAVFSVWFVYKRNNADMQSIMIARINTLQSMIQEHMRGVEGPEAIATPAVAQAVEAVGNNLKCDVTLFDVSGQVIMSTTPEVYERMILGHRLDDEAFNNIIHKHKRFFMHREQVTRRGFYGLYAPVLNSDGRMVAIVSSPYTDVTGDLKTEAILHIATVITIFLLLMMIARFVTSAVVSRLFSPITEMRRKMTVTDVDHLEPLIYNQDDELMPLVQAYNRMVHDLGESSRRLAQVERDKAWTDMARRVAHDLKNPLTPIKLQLQMLIRMKKTGNPLWQERFDEVAQTVLYHVDLLADSADQFSTFAKMYDQAPERLDLNALVRQEVDLFDSREDIEIEYFGLPDAFVMAPRPQLTRVVVNLITNAIQAVDEMEGEKRLVVSVRNAGEDGFYEIVVEDNGPGVSEQNQQKIFTPDFTTKTSGSGLGLAICQRIVEHCGGTISYSRSFTLGGACFTVKYPKA